MRHPHCVMTFSDAGAHVTQQECSLQTYLLAHWVRQKQEFTLEEAVRMVTLAPAEAWGFTDRGLLREVLAPDINTFDPARPTPPPPVPPPDFPTRAPLPTPRPAGILTPSVRGQTPPHRDTHPAAQP